MRTRVFALAAKRTRPIRVAVLGAVAVLGLDALVPACSRRASADLADAAPITSSVLFDAGVAIARDAAARTAEAPVASLVLPEPRALSEARPLPSTGAVPMSADPFGVAHTSSRAGCGVLDRHVSERDQKMSFVNGDDLLAIVNRSPTGQLPPDYAPTDLVDIRNGKAQTASDCEKVQCLRRDAAMALDDLLAQMKKEGFPGKVESAFRSYGAQCGTFGNWSRKSTFCDATEQSALPGHSQHQLGTTVDLFTEEWAKDERGVFREGFGCTPAGKYLQEHATEFGFVMPYPIHPDDRHPRQKCVVRWDIPININPRTGYRFEHWHIRYVGKEAATRFKTALAASGPGKPSEITVEQWLRAEKGISGADAELPVCDGCNCGACSTLAGAGENACDRKGGALHLDEHGKPATLESAPGSESARGSESQPSLEGATRGKTRKWHGRVVDVKLEVPVGTVTQPPIAGIDAATYTTGATFEKLAPYPDTDPRGYPPLAGAWVVAVEPVPNDTGVAWPWRAAISAAIHGQTYNRANVLLPTRGGSAFLKVPIPSGVGKAKVVLLQGGVPHGPERVVDFD
jgi:LAS superfamily LD-carboxypeptidase LdcB